MTADDAVRVIRILTFEHGTVPALELAEFVSLDFARINEDDVWFRLSQHQPPRERSATA